MLLPAISFVARNTNTLQCNIGGEHQEAEILVLVDTNGCNASESIHIICNIEILKNHRIKLALT